MTLTRIRHHAPPVPSSCRWCGEEQHHHGRSWVRSVGMHGWEEPTRAQVVARMRARRDDRLAARADRSNVRFHATANWSGSHIPDDEGQMYCFDCGRDTCPQFLRVQRRLDQSRWGIPGRRSTPIF